MCKEDVRIARRLETRSVVLSVGAFTPQSALGGRADRMRVIVACDPNDLLTNNAGIAIGRGVPGGVVPIAAISPSNPYVILRIEDYGDAIKGELSVFLSSPANLTVTVTEVFLRPDLDSV